ncbi:MAG: hypothetical protein ACYDEN_03820 [Acidimicrobiales bacterium]
MFYTEPTIGGTFGGYTAEVGTWTNETGCTSGREVNPTDVTDANANSTKLDGTQNPTGTALYFYGAGPGAYSGYNPNASLSTQENEANQWGIDQAHYVIGQYSTLGPTVRDYLIFMDIENPGTGMYNGWDEETDSCGRRTGTTAIPYAVDRWTFNGFYNTIANSVTPFVAGVYSSQSYWNYTFGTGNSGSLSDVAETASEADSGVVTPGPQSWCQSGYGCAEWFGGTNRPFAWQWAVVNGGADDYDQYCAPNAN